MAEYTDERIRQIVLQTLQDYSNALENESGTPRGAEFITTAEGLTVNITLPGVMYSKNPLTDSSASAQAYVQIPWAVFEEALSNMEEATAEVGNVNAELEGTTLTVTNRDGESTSVDTAEAAKQAKAEWDNTYKSQITTATANANTATTNANNATEGALRVNADLTGMTVTITNRNGQAKSVNIGFEIYRTYSSVSAMNADASNVPDGRFVMIATNDPTDPENARLYAKNSSGGFTFLSDLDQASSEAWADWLNNQKPLIEQATADANDAATLANTKAGIAQTAADNADASRVAIESNETTRQNNEATRQNQESARVTAETTRQTTWENWFSDTLSTGVRKLWNDFWPACKNTWENWFGTDNTSGVQKQWADLKSDAESDHATAQSDHTTAVTDHTTALSDHSTATTDHTTAEADHTQAGQDHERAETDHSVASTDHSTASTDHATAQDDHTQAESDHQTASSDHTLAGTDHDTAASDHTMAVTDHDTAEDDHETAETDHSTAQADHTQAESDTLRAGTDHQTAITDHSTAVSDHSTATDDHTQAEADTLRASTDHTTAQGDHTTALSDHTQAESDTQRASSDHSTAEGDHSTAASDHTTATTDHSTAATDHLTAISDNETAENDHTIAVADHETADDDHSTAENDHTIATDDHALASGDHSTAATDHSTADSDHVMATSDHNTAVADHTLAVADHNTASDDHDTAEADHTTAASDHTRAEGDHTTASTDHSSSTAQVAIMEEWNTHQPFIGDGTGGYDANYWYIYDTTNDVYVKSVYAKGDNLDWDTLTPEEKERLLDEMVAWLEATGFDTVPTQGSAHAVTSGGLYNTFLGKQDTISDLGNIRSGAAAGATAYQKPSTGIPSTDMSQAVQDQLSKTDLADFNEDSLHRLVTDAEKTTWNSKQDTISDIDTIRSGAAEGATAYQKPSTGIPATDMTQEVQTQLAKTDLKDFNEDSAHRLVTDAEKAAWNGKQDAINDLSTIRSGAASGATAYQKPSTGIPSTDMSQAVQEQLAKDDLADFNEDSTHRLVTDTEKTTWNSKQDALTFASVATCESIIDELV